MSEVKDRHRCGECKFYTTHTWFQKSICVKHENEFPHEIIDPDLEACSEFEPRRGWRE